MSRKSRTSAVAATREAAARGEYAEVPHNRIKPNPFQPRIHFAFDEADTEGMATSIEIATQGDPIQLTLRPGDDDYTIVDGERRWRGCCALAKERGEVVMVRAVIVPYQDEDWLFTMALLCNRSKKLHPLDLAVAWKQLNDNGSTYAEIGEMFDVKGATVGEIISLNRLDERVKALMDPKLERPLVLTHAKQIARIKDTELQLWLAEQSIAHEWSTGRIKQEVSFYLRLERGETEPPRSYGGQRPREGGTQYQTLKAHLDRITLQLGKTHKYDLPLVHEECEDPEKERERHVRLCLLTAAKYIELAEGMLGRDVPPDQSAFAGRGKKVDPMRVLCRAFLRITDAPPESSDDERGASADVVEASADDVEEMGEADAGAAGDEDGGETSADAAGTALPSSDDPDVTHDADAAQDAEPEDASTEDAEGHPSTSTQLVAGGGTQLDDPVPDEEFEGDLLELNGGMLILDRVNRQVMFGDEIVELTEEQTVVLFDLADHYNPKNPGIRTAQALSYALEEHLGYEDVPSQQVLSRLRELKKVLGRLDPVLEDVITIVPGEGYYLRDVLAVR